jgi:hypothetical protein
VKKVRRSKPSPPKRETPYPVLSAEQARILEEQNIRFLEVQYKAAKNPVYVWEAIADCLTDGLPIPEWAMAYLRRVALNVCRLGREDIPRKQKIAPAVMRAFEFWTSLADDDRHKANRKREGARNPFATIRKAGHEAGVAFEVYEQLHLNETVGFLGIPGTTGGHTKEASAIQRVVDTHPQICIEPRCRYRSIETVRTCWKKYQHTFSPLPHGLRKKK